jgi:hypothetical protein
MAKRPPKAGPDGRNQSRGGLEGAFSTDGVDLTLIRWMLSLSPSERLRVAQDVIDGARALRAGHEA